MMRRAVASLVFFLCLALPAEAEDIVSGLSQDAVQITSNYSGTDIVVFGAIERSDLAEGRDVVVVVRGPAVDMRVRRKDRVAGIWINRDQAVLHGMPSYYFLASTRPVGEIASAEVLQHYGLGLGHLKPESVSAHHASAPFEEAAIRHEKSAGLYSEDPKGVAFLGSTLFRVHVPVPSAVPRGHYNAEVYLFRGGTVISAQSSPLFIDQTGFERRLFDFAHEWPFAYGVLTVLVAAFLGWSSSLLFRQMA